MAEKFWPCQHYLSGVSCGVSWSLDSSGWAPGRSRSLFTLMSHGNSGTEKPEREKTKRMCNTGVE